MMFLLRIILIVLIGVFIYTIRHPERSHMQGRRWMYNNKPELSDMAKDMIKLQSIVMIIILLILLVISFTGQ